MNSHNIFVVLLGTLALINIDEAIPMEMGSLIKIFQRRFEDDDEDKVGILPRIRPHFLQINIKGYKYEDENSSEQQTNTRQIPVISDIERIKKIVEILEFIGEKVGSVIPSGGEKERKIADDAISAATDSSLEAKNIA